MGLLFGLVRGGLRLLVTLAVACGTYLAVQLAVEFAADLQAPLADVAAAREQLVGLTTQLEEATRQRRELMRESLDLKQQLLKLESSRPPYFTDTFPYTQFGKRWQHEAKIAAFTAVNGRLAEVERQQQAASAQVDALRQQLRQTQQQIDESLATPLGRAAVVIQTHWQIGLLIGVGVLLLPGLMRFVWYFLLAPLATRAPPVRLLPVGDADQQVQFTCSAAVKRLSVTIPPQASLYARAACVKEYAVGASKRTEFMWNWSAPLISYAAGLWELTRVDGGPGGCDVSLWSGDDADRQLVLVDLQNHPGLVFRPRHLVGLIHQPGTLRLRRRWRLLSLHAWCTLQLRYILLEGTGQVVLWALGGVEAASPVAGDRCVTQSAVAGFDGRLQYAVRRNETFWPYLRGREPLFDDCFAGDASYLVAVAGGQGERHVGLDGWLDRMLGVVGKVLGF